MTDIPFEGFPKQAITFYRDIAKNNDRGWFERHRSDFMDHVVEPAQSFITALGGRLAKRSKGVSFDTNHTGRGSFKKIHTDQRFRERPPFKTYCQMIFWEGPLATRKANSCLMIHFDPEKLALAAGLKYFDGKLVKAYREAVVDEKSGAQLRRAVNKVTKAGYRLGDVHYKKTPRGFDPEHKNAPLLLHNALYAHTSMPLPKAFHGPELLDLCEEQLVGMMPLHKWCVKFLNSAVD